MTQRRGAAAPHGLGRDRGTSPRSSTGSERGDDGGAAETWPYTGRRHCLDVDLDRARAMQKTIVGMAAKKVPVAAIAGHLRLLPQAVATVLGAAQDGGAA